MKSKVSHVMIIISLFIFKIAIFDYLRNRGSTDHKPGQLVSYEGTSSNYIR